MSYAFIAEVNAELRRRHAGVSTAVGWKERSKHTQPPSVCWVADKASYGDAVTRDDRVTQSIAGRTLAFNVDVWGRDPDETNALVKSVVRVCHRLGTVGAYAIEGEEWTGLEGSGGAILGEMATLTVSIRDDVDDDEEPAVAAPNPATPPTGGFT